MGINLTSKFSNGKKSRFVDLPEENQHITVALLPEENIVLNFPLNGVTSRSEGDTLILDCPGGQCIYLPGAFAGGGGLIMLSSGKLITVDELLELQAQKQSIETAEGELEGGVDRLASLGTDQFQRNSEPREDRTGPDAPGALSQGSSSSLGVGSGIGEFRSDSGRIVEGIWALPDQLTEYWGWSAESDRRQEGVFGYTGPREPVMTTSIAVVGSAANESATHITFTIAVTTADSLGCAVSFTVGGGSATAGADYDLTGLEYYDGASWQPLTADANGVFTVSVPGGSGNILIQLPLVDDAMSERNETVGLTVTAVTGSSGAVLTDTTSDTKLSGAAVIIEDTKNSSGTPNQPDEKDGPVISVERTSPAFVDESDNVGSAPSVSYAAKHEFALQLADCITNGSFGGVPNPGGGPDVLLQDIIISLKLGGNATFAAITILRLPPNCRRL